MSEQPAALDPDEFGRVAHAWKRWFPVLERGGHVVSERLVAEAGVRRGDRVLDIGTGLGEPALTAARASGTGSVLGVDVSPTMIALARERAARERITNVEYRVGDGAGDAIGPFDAVIGRWSLMFVDDLDALLARLRTLLRAGGRLAAATWSVPDEVPSIRLPVTIAAEAGIIPAASPPSEAFTLSDAAALRARIAGAGFTRATVERLPVVFAFDSAEHYVEHVTQMIPSVIALFAGLDDDARALLRETIRARVTERFGTSDGAVRIQNIALIASATAP